MGRADGRRNVARVPILNSGPVGTRLAAFIKGDETAHQFDTTDGRTVAGRHFTVRFARLKKIDGQPSRMLLSLIDKTAQVETEKSLRSEMLRDMLTGLPNRLAFNEKVDGVLADPAFRDNAYAVLAVDMTRFSRVNECMGAMAGRARTRRGRRARSGARPGRRSARHRRAPAGRRGRGRRARRLHRPRRVAVLAVAARVAVGAVRGIAGGVPDGLDDHPVDRDEQRARAAAQRSSRAGAPPKERL